MLTAVAAVTFFMILHVGGKSGGRVVATIAHDTLVGFLVVVGLWVIMQININCDLK